MDGYIDRQWTMDGRACALQSHTLPTNPPLTKHTNPTHTSLQRGGGARADPAGAGGEGYQDVVSDVAHLRLGRHLGG